MSRLTDVRCAEAATILLNFLAEDAIDKAKASQREEFSPKTWGAKTGSFEQPYEHYLNKADYWALIRLAELIVESRLRPFAEHFERRLAGAGLAFVTQSGVNKLRAEWPQIASEFGLKKL
jgi:hypothetical protein